MSKVELYAIFCSMKYFLKIFVLGMIIFLTASCSVAFDIVYPKTKTRTTDTATIFFIGASKTPLTVNGENVNLHPTGAFAHFVNLKEGLNSFTFKTEDKEETYTIIRKSQTQKTAESSKFIAYNSPKYLVVNKDLTPLRETPINAGINRLSHLQKGVKLVSDGEKGGFYRVSLNNFEKAWISKDNVSFTEYFSPAIIKGYQFQETSDYYIFTFNLDKKITYKITENVNSEDLSLKFYNTSREDKFTFPYKAKTGAKNFWGYSGEYIENTQQGDEKFIFKIRKPPITDKKHPLKGITITVDPGHGGKELGAIGCLGDKEKDVVLKIAKYLEKDLKSKGANVIMTRTHDEQVGLNERVKIANDNNSTFFVSIHNNALPDTLNPNDYRGTGVYYYYNQAKSFAQTILDTMTKDLGTQNSGLHQESFAVVRNTNALSILVEVAYLINPYDNEMLINTDFQKAVAKSVADGIEKYVLENAK